MDGATYLVPVGYSGGVIGDAGERRGIVRVAEDYFTLSLEEFELWLLCLKAVQRSDILEEAATRGLLSAARDLEGLQSQGLVVPVRGRVVEDRAVLEELRLQLLVIGLGSETEEPTRLWLGSLAHGPMIELDPITYALLIGAPGRSSMWDMCGSAALELETDCDELATRLLGAIPLLLSSGAAYLDRTG